MHYQEEYPALLLHEQESRLQVVLIKSDVWAYEQEFRLICARFTNVKGSPLLMDGDYLSIGSGDLKSIIIGCQADDGTTNTIKALVRELAPQVAVRYASRAPNKYRLVIES